MCTLLNTKDEEHQSNIKCLCTMYVLCFNKNHIYKKNILSVSYSVW